MLKNSKIFRKFLISYIVILIIPSIAGSMSYRTSIAVTQSISIENSITQLQKAQEILERRMAEVEGFTRQLALNEDLYVLINKKPNNLDVYEIWKMTKQISSYSQTNDFLQNFYIYLKNFNIILKPGSAYFRPEHYYLTSYYNDLSLDEWKKTFFGKTHSREILPLRPFVNGGTQTSAITYLQSLPLSSTNGSSPAIVVVNIDSGTIDSLLSDFQDRYGGWANISDEQGHTISIQGTGKAEMGKLDGDPRFDKQKISQFYNGDLVITIRSKTNGWIYQAGIPRDVLMENANTIKYISWAVTGVALLIGLLVGLVLSYRNCAPINRLLGIMKEQFGKDEAIGRNEYDFLYGNISTIITNNKHLESELNRQLPLVRDAFLKRLIAGEFRTREEIESAVVLADIGLNVDTGYAGILQIHGYAGMDSVEILNELNTARLILKQAMLDDDSHILLTDLGSDRIVAIFASKSGEAGTEAERENIQNTLDKHARFVFDEYRITITAALGNYFSTAMEVSYSFEQARKTMEHTGDTNGQGTLWFSEIQMKNETYYYPLELELRLIRTIRAGDIDEAKSIVGLIIARNTETWELSVEMKHQLIGELKGTLLKLLDQKTFLESDTLENVKNRIIDISTNDAIEPIQREIDGIMEELCELIASKKNAAQAKIVEQINQYVAEAYGDPQLNLYRIAEKMERPEKYISQLFKEVTGTNLSDHLEKIRMDQAAVLLSANDQTIDEIASRVGYNSSHTFRRAFKRVMGASPSSYRQTVKD
ncbi:helix-turn-helix domain-containing protein [Paenibacillus solisilvae]|uniref:Helix-turn-helix domain-containing protein n=1 Tax=Paenibacillus solisilvae TaxID=2486751 RepID=A0ABW0W6I5_9BACL